MSVSVISPSGILSMLDSTKTAFTRVPLPFSELISKLPPVISDAVLKKGTPSPVFLVFPVV